MLVLLSQSGILVSGPSRGSYRSFLLAPVPSGSGRRGIGQRGRRRADSVEIGDAPPSPEVRHTAQKSFSPRALCCAARCPGCQGATPG